MDRIDGIADVRAFAHSQGWTYDDVAEPPALGSGLWERVSHGIVRGRVRGPGWEAGRITGGERQAQNVEQRGGWTITSTVRVSTPSASIDLGYLAITLPRRLPHLILDAKGNDRGPFSSLVNRPRGDQTLSLEGDFDAHFRLYVPAGYERDALYVFTPDLMALLIDEAGDLDVEVRDDRLIVYKPGGFDVADPATWARFDSLRRTIGAKAWSQTDMYLDDRVPTPQLQFAGPAVNEVDSRGTRLRQRMPRMVWVGVGIGVLTLAFAVTVVAVVLTQVLR